FLILRSSDKFSLIKFTLALCSPVFIWPSAPYIFPIPPFWTLSLSLLSSTIHHPIIFPASHFPSKPMCLSESLACPLLSNHPVPQYPHSFSPPPLPRSTTPLLPRTSTPIPHHLLLLLLLLGSLNLPPFIPDASWHNPDAAPQHTHTPPPHTHTPPAP